MELIFFQDYPSISKLKYVLSCLILGGGGHALAPGDNRPGRHGGRPQDRGPRHGPRHQGQHPRDQGPGAGGLPGLDAG